MEEKLFILLETKSFDSLSEEERLFVLSQMSEQEYIEQYNIIGLSKKIIDDELSVITPDKQLLTSILETEEKQNFFIGLLQYKVSLPRVAAVFLITFFSYHLVVSHIYEPKSTETIIVNNTDTIYKIKEVFSTDTVYLTEYKTKIIKPDCKNKKAVIAEAKPEQKISEQQYEYYKQKVLYDLKNNKIRRGKSASKLSNKLTESAMLNEDNTFVRGQE